MQSLRSLPMRLARVVVSWFIMVAPLVALAQPLSSAGKPPAPRVQAVQFRSGDTTLSGVVLIPKRVVAAVVIVHGSGKEPRDLTFARELAQRGIATLTYDKRGVGKSGGVYAGPEVGTNNVDTQNLSLLADDAVAAMKELSRRIAAPKVALGFIGMSQAGWIIPLAAARAPDVKFTVIWSGPMVTTLEQLRFQFFTEGKPDFWAQHREAAVREHVRSAPDRYLFAPTDPVDSLKTLSTPGLWLYGRKDLNVPASLSIERLNALKASGKTFDVVEFAEAGHQLPFQAALTTTTKWIAQHVGSSATSKQ